MDSEDKVKPKAKVKNKLGLSLSGGGFRASFYHIGVLARMAELGLLRKTELISTVSGGSIVGVAYFILLKHMLEKYDESEITDQHYIDLVATLAVEFRLPVQKNLRWRTFANPLANIKMGLPSFSRSDQIGILYDKFIFNKLVNQEYLQPKGGLFKRTKKFLSFWLINPNNDISGLKIYPKNCHNFHRAGGNQQRNAKVPALVVNATSLNSGHNWVFTTRAMGEVMPRNTNFQDINKNDQYTKILYSEIQKPRKKGFPLGKAVAASAGVLGIFPPMAISNLYKEGRVVQLVDGGVFDNMGIAGLQHDPSVKLTHFIISDASGQGESSDNPATDSLSVLLHTTNLLMARLREEMVDALINEQDQDRVAYFHLNRGVKIEQHRPIGESSELNKLELRLQFKVEEEMQHALSQIRTDLDSFSDKEIFALEQDGFLMSEPSLSKLLKTMDDHSVNAHLKTRWEFNAISLAKNTPDYQDLLIHVRAGKHKLGRLYHFGFLKSILALIIYMPSVVLTAALIFYAYEKLNIGELLSNSIDFNLLLIIALGLLALKIAEAVSDNIIKGSSKWLKWIPKLFRLPQTLLVQVILPILVSVPILLYLATVDKFFVYHGRVKSHRDYNGSMTGPVTKNINNDDKKVYRRQQNC